MSRDPYEPYDTFDGTQTDYHRAVDSQWAPSRRSGGPASTLRRGISIGLVALGALCLVGGAVMTWVDSHVFDTDSVVETTHTMMRRASIRELVRTELDQRIVGVVDPLVAPYVDPAVVAVIDDPRFAGVLDDAVRIAHSTLVDGNAEAIVFSLGDVVPIVKEKLDAVDPTIFPLIPDLRRTLDYTLTQRSELPAVWDAVDRFHRAALALLIFGAVLIALALVIGPSRWALLLLVGVSTLVVTLVIRLAAGRIHATIEGRIDEPGTRTAAVEVAELFTAPLERQMAILMVIGGLIAVAGVVVRLLRPAFVRHP